MKSRTERRLTATGNKLQAAWYGLANLPKKSLTQDERNEISAVLSAIEAAQTTLAQARLNLVQGEYDLVDENGKVLATNYYTLIEVNEVNGRLRAEGLDRKLVEHVRPTQEVL